MDWFQKIFGFKEKNYTYKAIQKNFIVQNTRLYSRKNNKSYQIGTFELVSLKKLKEIKINSKKIHYEIIYGDVSELMADPNNVNCTFMVASQFNCLQFPNHFTYPEEGITDYVYNISQGTACSIATGPATLYRNYFVTFKDGTIGQNKNKQINTCNCFNKYYGWKIKNGFAIVENEILEKINKENFKELKSKLRFGIHNGVQVTSAHYGTYQVKYKQFVNLVLCPSCNVKYNPSELWKPIATMFLEAAYEATILSAIKNKSEKVFLTTLDGDPKWIKDIIHKTVKQYPGIKVYLVCN